MKSLVLLLLAHLSLYNLLFSQSSTELVLKNLNEENTTATTFYLKNLSDTKEKSLFEIENLILQKKYLEANSSLNSLSTKDLSICQSTKLLTFKALILLSGLKYAESNKQFKDALALSGNCIHQKSTAQIFYWYGFSLLNQQKYDSGNHVLHSALTYYKKDSVANYVKIAKLNFWIGTANQELGNQDSATYWLNKALRIFENSPLDKTLEIAKVYNNLGNAYAAKWDYSKTIEAYSKSIELLSNKNYDASEMASAYANLGSVYNQFENYSKAEGCYSSALNWLQKIEIDPPRKALILQNYGSVLTRTYKLNEALAYYREALKIINPYQLSHMEIYTDILLNMMKTYSLQERYSEALGISEALDDMLKKENKRFLGQYYSLKLSQSNQLINVGSYQEARELLDEIEVFFASKKLFLEQAEVITAKGVCYVKEGNHLKSVEQYKKGLSLLSPLLPATHPQIIFLYNQIGGSFYEGLAFDSAYHFFQKAKILNQLPNHELTRMYASKIEWIVSNFYLLKMDLEKFETGKISFENLRLSEGLILSTLSVLESKRIEFRTELDATNLYRMTRDFFGEAMKYYFTLYKHTGDRLYIDKAFLISEKSKYQTLQNAMKLDRVSAFAGVTNKLMQEEQKLAGQVAQLEYQYSQELAKQEEPLPELVQEYVSQWHSNSSRLNYLVDSIKNNLPDYYNLKFNRATTEIGEIQIEFLSKEKDMAWVSYYVGYTDSYAIVITHDHKYFLKLDPTEKITRQLKSFNNYVSHHINDELQQTSHALYTGLFQPVDSCLKIQSKKIKKVVIIPDGSLNYLNFELLGKPTNKSWHYALYDYQFSYGYSSTLLFNEFSNQPKWKSGTLNMIGFAPEFVKSSRQESGEVIRDANEKPGYDFFDFSPLEKNQDEVSHVAEILKHNKINSTLYLGAKADESSFKKADLNTYNIIHLATHGFVSEQQQNIAGIAFAKNENSQDDGILYMDEIFNLKNRANLVCLSACETGSGVLQQGEGLVGLTRAFIYSGAQNLVVSLWKVQDESTATLMTNFYSSLVKNQSVSESLQHAKIAMIKKNPTIHPYYWSAFIHVGLN